MKEINKAYLSHVKNMNRKQIISEFSKSGYVIGDRKIWKTNTGKVGVEIGRIDHQCHIDQSTFVYLLLLGYSEHEVEGFMDFFLTEIT